MQFTNKRNRMVIALFGVALIGCSHPGTASRPEPKFGHPIPDATVEDLRIDALHPETVGSPAYSRTSRVRVVVANINPFRYDYRILSSDSPWFEASPADFFDVLLGITLPRAKAPPEANAGGSGDNKLTLAWPLDRGEQRPEGCTAASEPLARRYAGQVASLVTVDSTIDAEIAALQSLIKAYEAASATDRRTMKAIDAEALQVLNAARRNASLLRPVVDSTTTILRLLPDRITVLAEMIRRLDPLITGMRNKYPECELFIDVTQQLSQMTGDTLILRSNSKILSDWQRNAILALEAIDRVIDDTGYFYATRRLEGYKQPTDVTIRVQRKLPGEDTTHWSSILERRLNFGGLPRFSIGVGVAWTDLATREYEARQEFGPGFFQGRPADSVIRVVAVKEVSWNRIMPIITLNTRLWSFESPLVDGFHLTLGGTLRKQSDNIDPEFVLGGGLTGLDQRVMIGGGWYVGRTQRLANGVALGDPLPQGQGVPVQKRIAWRPAVMLSFRLK